MYASEVINQLSELVTKYGDHPVKSIDDEELDYVKFDDDSRAVIVEFDEG
jgi:hypothetical protein